jgi:NTP pyrophosphatase (non-canonical NTP hydrolase)
MNDIEEITKALLNFRDERNWEQFHNSKDLAAAISIEAGELLEAFLWRSADEAKKEKIEEELADVLSFALLLAHQQGIDVKKAMLDKIEKNRQKYPVEKAKGTAKKYNEL